MNWIKYQIHTTTDAVEVIGEMLYELNIPGFEITDNVPLTPGEEKQMFTDIPAQMPPDDGTAIITFYTEEGNEEREFYSTGSSLRDENLEQTFWNPDELIRILTERMEQIRSDFPFPKPSITVSQEDDSQWKDKWKDHFQAFRIAEDVIIKPVWEETPAFAKKEDIIVEIEPGSAFGTGTHETTQLCLLALRRYLTPSTSILDAGCGSGILAISALLCGAGSAFCLDIDPSAVEGTRENARRNNLDSSRIQAVHADILAETDRIHQICKKPFDIAVANILADVIIPLSDCIGDFIKPEGIFISSGILAERADSVEAALLQNHFQILEKNTMGDWISFVAKKESL